MKKVLVSIGCIIGLIVLFFMFAPEDRTNGAKESWRRLTNDSGQAALDYIRKGLNDPDSARIISYKWQDGSRLSVTYKAKNSYGAYVSNTDIYRVSYSGVIVCNLLFCCCFMLFLRYGCGCKWLFCGAGRLVFNLFHGWMSREAVLCQLV